MKKMHVGLAALAALTSFAGDVRGQLRQTDEAHLAYEHASPDKLRARVEKVQPEVAPQPHSHRSGSRITARAPNVASAQRIARIIYVQNIIRQNPNLSRALKELAEKTNAMLGEMRSINTHLISRTSSTDQTVRATMEVSHDPQAFKAELQQVAALAGSNFRLVSLLPEYIDGERVNSHGVEFTLDQELINHHFHVYDWNFVATEQPIQNTVRAALQQTPGAEGELGRWFLANWILTGRVECTFSQDTEGILSYNASCDLKTINVQTGRRLALQPYEATGFGDTRPKAQRDALKRLAALIAADMPPRLAALLDEQPVIFTVNLNNPGAVTHLTDTLRQIPGISDVRVESLAHEYTIRIKSRDNVYAISNELERLEPSIHVLSYGHGAQ